jgi:DNA mismatch endonuclease (patch repair protein)
MNNIMADFLSPAKRSKLMSCIRSSGNRDTELRLISIFRAHGIIGWRRNYKLLGKPDFVFPRRRLAVFVDGCFWHGCPKHVRFPKTNRRFWREKITRNMGRDREVGRVLRGKGWRVLRVWEHALFRRWETRTVARVKRALQT